MDDKRQMPPPQPPAHYIGDKGRYVAHFDQRGKVTAVYLNGRLISKNRKGVGGNFGDGLKWIYMGDGSR